MDGEKIITTEVNDQDDRERFVGEEITIEMVPWIIIRGKLTEEETSQSATESVEKLFTDIQAGIDSEHHSQTAAQIAEFSITSIQVEDPKKANAEKPGEQKGMVRYGPDKNRKLQAITENFIIRVRVPIVIEYQLFGREFRFSEKWDVTRPPTDTTWTFPAWGITAAAAPALTVTLSENTITLDGIAQTNDSTLVVITTDKRQNNNLVSLPSGTQEYFNMINYPRGYAFLGEVTEIKTFPLIIESGMLGYGSQSHEFIIELIP